MGIRRGAKLTLTVAMPLLDRYVRGEHDYFRRKEEACEALLAYLNPRREKINEIVVHLNALDRRQAGIRGIYLSVLGTSAEDADSGQVGRGNQVNGIIALNRPRGSEAAGGKNPVSHVGKIYTVLTHLLAEQIFAEVPGLRQVTVWLCARIGDPVDQPQIAAVQVVLERHTELSDLEAPIRRIMARELERMPRFCQALASGKYSIC
jgi:S-adenosylmethionine synthetase